MSEPNTPAEGPDLGEVPPSEFAAADLGTMPPAEPPKRNGRKIATIMLGSVAALAVLCCGGGYLVGHDYISQGNASLSTPDEVAGLVKSTQSDLQDVADQMAAALSSTTPLNDMVAVTYDDPEAKDKAVVLAGGTRFIWQPGKELETAFAGAENGGLPVTDLKDEDPGKLGGAVRCGTAKEETTSMSVCAWADHGSLVIGVFVNRAIGESADLLRQIRADMLHR